MKTNKVIASALAFIMATTMAAGSVFAAGEKVTISADKVEAAAGSEFSVDIKLSDVPATGVMACEFALSYDASALTVTGVTAGAITSTGSDSAESDISGECPSFYADYSNAGTVNLTWSTGLTDTSYWIAEDGVFATITGTVSAGAAAGEYPIEIVPISREDISGTNSSILAGYVDASQNIVEYEVAVSNGSVTVPGATTGTTTTTKPAETTTTSTTTTTGGTETTAKTSTVPSDVRYGDVNLDSTVSLVDVVYLNKALANSITLNDQAKKNANCCTDAEGMLNAADATVLLKYIVEIVKELPVTPEA